MNIKTLIVSVMFCLTLSPVCASADTVDIREWLVPWKKSGARDTYLDSNGRVWFAGQRQNFLGNLTPETGEFSRYDIQPRSAPNSLIVDGERNIWYTSSRLAHIGRLSPGSGSVSTFDMPVRKARDLHSLTFDSAGNIWFTVPKDNFVGKLTVATGNIDLIQAPTKKSEPYGIVVNSKDELWVAAFGSNKLLRVDSEAMTLEEVTLPNKKSRSRRLIVTSDDNVWYADYELGVLGRYNPQTGDFREWSMPGGKKSRPYGMTVDKNDRIWIVETGDTPNRFVGFDTGINEFTSITEIPSGADSVSNLHYYQPAGEVWFATKSNYIGRAKVH